MTTTTCRDVSDSLPSTMPTRDPTRLRMTPFESCRVTTTAHSNQAPAKEDTAPRETRLRRINGVHLLGKHGRLHHANARNALARTHHPESWLSKSSTPHREIATFHCLAATSWQWCTTLQAPTPVPLHPVASGRRFHECSAEDRKVPEQKCDSEQETHFKRSCSRSPKRSREPVHKPGTHRFPRTTAKRHAQVFTRLSQSRVLRYLRRLCPHSAVAKQATPPGVHSPRGRTGPVRLRVVPFPLDREERLLRTPLGSIDRWNREFVRLDPQRDAYEGEVGFYLVQEPRPLAS